MLTVSALYDSSLSDFQWAAVCLITSWARIMTSIVFSLKSWIVWMPDGVGGDCWRGSAAPVASAPLVLRRRVSPLGQHVLQAAWEQSEKDCARLVFSSRHGELSRTLSILDSVIAGAEISPADFTLSVHQALAGLLSIASKNVEGYNSVSAGADSLFTALLEAAACQAEQSTRPVLLAHYDESLPQPYDQFDVGGGETAALVLNFQPGGRCYRLSWGTGPMEETSDIQPVAALVQLLSGEVSSVTISGDRLVWGLEDLGEALYGAA